MSERSSLKEKDEILQLNCVKRRAEIFLDGPCKLKFTIRWRGLDTRDISSHDLSAFNQAFSDFKSETLHHQILLGLKRYTHHHNFCELEFSAFESWLKKLPDLKAQIRENLFELRGECSPQFYCQVKAYILEKEELPAISKNFFLMLSKQIEVGTKRKK